MFKDFTHYAYQLAFYTENPTIAPDEFSVLCRKTLRIGNATPSFVPEFPGMPPEIPRVQIQSDSGYSITLSGVRVDIILDLAYGIGDEERAIYLENARLLVGMLSQSNFRFLRAGFVKRYLKVVDEPGRRISQCFGGHGGGEVVDFSVNSVLRREVLGRKCNDIYNYSAGVIRGVDQGVVAYRDINIVLGEPTLTSAEAAQFIELTESMLSAESLVQFVGAV